VFKAAIVQAGGMLGTGFTQRPAYLYAILRNPNAYGNKGCPYNCHLYRGKVDWPEGLCPVAEDVIPRMVSTNNMVPVSEARKKAASLKKAIKLAESGGVKPLTYSKLDKRVLNLVKAEGPLEPSEVIGVLKERGWGDFIEHDMFAIMEGLRDRFPYKLSHAGPRKYAYHDLR
jgi:hypothetical protein